MVEPFYHWRNLYIASDDPSSPFYGREYSEFHFEHHIYDFYIHPQWDDIGSPTLFIKILYVDYEDEYAIIEMIGEWNDTIENDIMTFKRDICEELMEAGINQFILIGENVLNFHSSDDCYYEEWVDDAEDGWVAMINFHEHVINEFQQAGIDQYFFVGGQLNEIEWRTFLPTQLYEHVKKIIEKRLE